MRLEFIEEIEPQSLEIDCWYGDIFATWKSSLKESSFTEEEYEFKEYDEDQRFWINWRPHDEERNPRKNTMPREPTEEHDEHSSNQRPKEEKPSPRALSLPPLSLLG